MFPVRCSVIRQSESIPLAETLPAAIVCIQLSSCPQVHDFFKMVVVFLTNSAAMKDKKRHTKEWLLQHTSQNHRWQTASVWASVCTIVNADSISHCNEHKLPVLEHHFIFRMLHFRLSTAHSQDFLVHLLRLLFRVFFLPPPCSSESCVLRATYFLWSYDNKLNQRSAQSCTTHSSFSLPTQSLLSLTLHFNSTQSSMCHISPQLVNHFYADTAGTLYHIL